MRLNRIALPLFALAAIGAAPDPRFAQLRARIAAYCHGKPACMDEQRTAAKNFIGAGVLYSPPQQVMRQCLAGATKDKLTNWAAARACVRAWASNH